MVRLIELAALALAASLQLSAGAAAQQTFPTRTVRFILPFGAASGPRRKPYPCSRSDILDVYTGTAVDNPTPKKNPCQSCIYAQQSDARVPAGEINDARYCRFSGRDIKQLAGCMKYEREPGSDDD